ncbi:MAG: CRISPR-associated helicase Cas3' [Oscillospiraceae bacterium]|jgi:CRISPR-associated helicase Cas3/CRISPR-associated endonuclease Cas3-HD|nr:CRISPR-associated helicase Cas3' [Oscillospiraceae bacterium]
MPAAVFAHTKEDSDKKVLPESEWQTLDAHLTAVAALAREFAEQFGAGELAYAAGLLHDIGKATETFQQRLRGKNIHADHKTAGARIAVARYGKQLGKLLAYIISGHHGGLPDDASNYGEGLDEMLSRPDSELLCTIPETSASIMLPKTEAQSIEHLAFYITMLTRMVFSALVDADYLDTEAFASHDKSELRPKLPPIACYCELFVPKLQKLLSYPQDNPVSIARRGVLSACLSAAESPRGFFKLTVPTGGGKTLSSLAFALRHAEKHGMKRIIYAIPFTSITEQTADVFREIFGSDLVLEHHSNAGAENKADGSDENGNERDVIRRLACENWDAPLVVTTNVQFFESLFAAKPSKARKLHNIANSVIILDEAQSLPDDLLLPTLAALKCLVADFGATVVFCTATQPSLKPKWLDGLAVTEIVPDTGALFSELSRTKVSQIGEISNEVLAEQLRGRKQALCIVNTRGHAKKLFNLLGDSDGFYHLSAVMCPEHRTRVLDEIKARLTNNQRCVVVSTQLIEAGVDIDFPCVYRSVAGIDSIAQAAGRCNREGELTDENGEPIPGEVLVFTPEDGVPRGRFQRMAKLGTEVMKAHPNPLLPDAIEQFFNLRYGLDTDLDAQKILSGIAEGWRKMSFSYREIEHKYKLIQDNQTSVIIPYDDKARELLREAQGTIFPMKYLRGLQRYTVSVHADDYIKLHKYGFISEIGDEMGIYALREENMADCYIEKLGLVSDFEMKELIF